MSIQEIIDAEKLNEIQSENISQNLFIPLNTQTRVERLNEEQQKKAVILQQNLKKSAIIICIILISAIIYGVSLGRPSQENVQKTHDELAGILPTNNKEYISLLFGGDVLLDGRVGDLIEQKGEKYIFSGVQEVFDKSDILMVNLENPISSAGVKYPGKQFNFRAKPTTVSALTAAGIDIVSLANNHVLDYGVDALKDTINILEKNNIKHVGAGTDIDKAVSPVYFNIGDTKIAILASSRVIPTVDWAAGASKPGVFRGYFLNELKPKIVQAKENADIVVVYMHWGEEGKSQPQDYQKQLGHDLIDAGADMVIGAHPHVVEGIEIYKEKVIAYSLGNFVFNNNSKDTFMLEIQLKNKSIDKMKIVPSQITDCIPYIITDNEKRSKFIEMMNSISFNVKFDEQGTAKILDKS